MPTLLPVVALIARWLGITKLIQTLSSSHDTVTSHYDPSKARAPGSTAPIRSFANTQGETSQGRDTRSSAGRSSTPSIYIYEEQAWAMEDGGVAIRDYRLRVPTENKSGESILLQEMKPKDLEQGKPSRRFS